MAKPPGESAPIVRIFLSSPSDVAEERKIARELIQGELQGHPSYRHLKLEVIAWDDPAARIPMLANETPQESVNNARPRPSTCDIVIVILWARMGTPLPESIRKPDGGRYLSGTEWEYLDAINSTREPKPEVLVYRRTEEPMISARDRKKMTETLEQLDLVDSFFNQFSNNDASLNGGLNDYATPRVFGSTLYKHLGELLHQRLATSATSTEWERFATIPPEYIEWLRCQYSDISVLGQELQEGQSLTLNHVYVPTCIQSNGWDIELALQRLDRESLYIQAPAGAGKSTFCRWAVLQSIAVAELTHPVPPPVKFAEPLPANLRGHLPLLIPLRDFHEDIDCGRGHTGSRRQLENALVAWVNRALGERLRGDNLMAHLRAGSAFLLLDGLDEVPISDIRDGATVYPRDILLSSLADALPMWLTAGEASTSGGIVEAVARKLGREFAAAKLVEEDWVHKAGNRVLLTSRPYGLDESRLRRLGLPHAPLEPLPEPLQDLFVARWFHAIGKPEQAQGLIAAIRKRDDLAPLAENPMMLTALCVLWDSGGRLPEDRYELYRRIVNNVLFHRFRDEVRQREPARARLEAIAHGMHVGDRATPRESPAAEISHLEIDHILQVFAAEDPSYERGRVGPVAQREELLTRSGLLLPRAGDRAAFYHLSVQEFLAAERILRTEDDLEPVFRARGAVAEWRPTLLFLFAGKIAGRTPRWGADLLDRLIAEQDRAAVKANPAPAMFIAEALDLCLAKTYAVPEELKEAFRHLAQDAIEDEVELQARQALGLTLGRVGDLRIFDLRDANSRVDLKAYVEVPAGTYPYGNGDRVVEIAAPLFVGRYPVTNQQYAAFIADAGYTDRQWWSKAGWAWREKEQATEPRFWQDRRWNGPNQPVVGVCFWEAKAFCSWAGVRLPTEEEWEAAARGSEGVIFPWGNAWHVGICNTREAKLGASSPVGLFPRAQRGDCTIEDLAGNVWEWCDSLYDTSANGRRGTSRVLRGGSWDNNQDYARLTVRNRFNPPDREDIVGFRVVRSSPPSGH